MMMILDRRTVATQVVTIWTTNTTMTPPRRLCIALALARDPLPRGYVDVVCPLLRLRHLLSRRSCCWVMVWSLWYWCWMCGRRGPESNRMMSWHQCRTIECWNSKHRLNHPRLTILVVIWIITVSMTITMDILNNKNIITLLNCIRPVSLAVVVVAAIPVPHRHPLRPTPRSAWPKIDLLYLGLFVWANGGLEFT